MKEIYSFFILLLLCFLCINGTQAQESYEEYKRRQSPPESYEEEKSEKKTNATDGKGWSWQNLRVGGNFGLQFGSRTYIELSPTLGYQINTWLQVGLTSKFIYFSQRNDINFVNNFGQPVGTIPAFKSVIGGIGTYAQFFPYKGLFIHTEYELINKEPFNPSNPNRRINVSHLLLGGGYAIPMGQVGTFNISALFNVLDNEESIYAGTFGGLPVIIRMGVNVGIPGGRR